MSSLIAPLASGFSDAASGTAEFYERGTNTAAVVYSDYDATTVRTSHPLDSNGRLMRYTTTPVDVVVKDADADTVASFTWGDSAGAVVVENAGFTGVDDDGSQAAGGVTDADAVLTSLTTSLNGPDGKYKEVGSSTSRYLYAVIGKYVSPSDFGATGGDSIDESTAFQNAINRAGAANKPLWIEAGTYRIGTALTASGSTFAGLTMIGANRADVILKNTSASNTLLTVDLASAIDSKIEIANLTFTASTTSSGKALLVSNGDKVLIRNVSVLLHRFGIDVSAVSGASVANCIIESSDGDTTAIGINLGNRGRARECEASCSSAFGTGIKATGVDGRIDNCYISGWSKGIDYAGARTAVKGAHISAATIGANMGAANATLMQSYLVLNTTGVSIGAVASPVLLGNVGASNTADLTINASATLVTDVGNSFTTITTNASTHRGLTNSGGFVTSTGAGASFPCTPDVTGGKMLFIFVTTYAAGPAFTMNACTGAATLHDGDVIEIVIINNTATGSSTCTWNAQYETINAQGSVSSTGPGNALAQLHRFRWNGTSQTFRRIMFINSMTY